MNFDAIYVLQRINFVTELTSVVGNRNPFLRANANGIKDDSSDSARVGTGMEVTARYA